MITAVINTYVHIFMYSYYFLSSFKQLAKYTNAVKPILTAVQIAQLVVLLGQCIVGVLPGCNGTRIYYLHFVNVSVLIFLFTKFYLKSYVKQKKREWSSDKFLSMIKVLIVNLKWQRVLKYSIRFNGSFLLAVQSFRCGYMKASSCEFKSFLYLYFNKDWLMKRTTRGACTIYCFFND